MRKRFFNIMLSVILLCTLFVCGNAQADMVQPLYNNTSVEHTGFNIDSNGLASVTISYIGYKGVTTSAKIEIEIKKRGFLGLSWSTVDIGEPNNIKIYVFNEYTATSQYTVQLNSKGTYKAIIKYTIYGSGGEPDVITREIEKKY